MSNRLRIVFMGTPEFAVASLNAMCTTIYTPVAVVTAPDKPAGRGLKLQSSPVKQFALEHSIEILQPQDLNDEEFLQQLKNLSADLIVVVAFRKLPDAVLHVPSKGAFNLHASLLPQYRGAAPINHAIINGETETGVTTFLLNNRIDAGKILLQEKVKITEHQTASELHDVLMDKGASLVVQTLKSIETKDYQAIEQDSIIMNAQTLKKAPKIFKDDCRISWNKGAKEINNLIRGLCLIPGAFTELVSPEGMRFSIKILRSYYELCDNSLKTGTIETDGSSYLRVRASDGYLYFQQVQLAGKKIMTIDEFLRGFKISSAWYI